MSQIPMSTAAFGNFPLRLEQWIKPEVAPLEGLSFNVEPQLASTKMITVAAMLTRQYLEVVSYRRHKVDFNTIFLWVTNRGNPTEICVRMQVVVHPNRSRGERRTDVWHARYAGTDDWVQLFTFSISDFYAEGNFD